MAISERAKQSIAAGGGRHYRGRGLGALKGWKCVACDAENAGPITAGCIACGAGAPGTQVRRPGDAVPDGGAKVAETKQTTRELPPKVDVRRAPGPLKIRAPQSVDYDEIERRVARALESRLGGGYTDVERATIYNALSVYIGAWEDRMIEPDTGLNLEKTRELAARVAPDEMPAMLAGEAESNGTTETETNTARSGDAAGGAPGYDSAGDPGANDEGPGDGFDDLRAVDPGTDPGDRTPRNSQ